jgi:hypothetical protein
MLIVKEKRYLSLSCSIKYQFNEASLREGFQQQWGRTGEENCRKIWKAHLIPESKSKTMYVQYFEEIKAMMQHAI